MTNETTNEEQNMKNENTFHGETESVNLISQYSGWTATAANLQYRPYKGCEPNRFHRFMQRLCFGIVWRRDQ